MLYTADAAADVGQKDKKERSLILFCHFPQLLFCAKLVILLFSSQKVKLSRGFFAFWVFKKAEMHSSRLLSFVDDSWLGKCGFIVFAEGKGNIQSVRSLFPFFATHTLSKGRKGGGGGEALHPPSFSPKFIHARPANGRLIHKGQQMALPLPSFFPRREGAPPSPLPNLATVSLSQLKER